MESVTLNRGKDVYVPIQLKKEWMGHPKKAKMTLIKSKADELIARGTAKAMEKKRRRLLGEKVVEEPAKDKMLSGPTKSK